MKNEDKLAKIEISNSGLVEVTLIEIGKLNKKGKKTNVIETIQVSQNEIETLIKIARTAKNQYTERQGKIDAVNAFAAEARKKVNVIKENYSSQTAKILKQV